MISLIQPSVEIIKEKDIYKKVELVGRTCYKSEAKITEDSAKAFYDMLISRNHLAMVEHAIKYYVKYTDGESNFDYKHYFCNYKHINYTKEYFSEIEKYRHTISANMRVILEHPILKDILKSFMSYANFCELLEDNFSLTAKELQKHKYTTMRFITDRGVSHELVRHRLCSFAQESTRYVNYNKKGMKFIMPAKYAEWSSEIKGKFLSALATAEDDYNYLIQKGLTPQEARAVLPNATKTEVIVTANDEEWQHIFKLRCDKAAHPDMQKIMNMAEELYFNEEKNSND